MARHGFAFFRDADRRLEERRIHLARGGYLFLAHDGAGWDALTTAATVQHTEGIATETLAPQALMERFAFLAPDETLLGGTFLQDDGYLDNPRVVVHALERRCRAHGVEFRFEAVREIVAAGGRATGVRTDSDTVSADRIVVAAGVATPSLLRPLGIDCPIVREPKHLLFSAPIEERFLEPLVIAPTYGVAAKQLASGHVMASVLDGTDPDDLYLWRRKIRAFAERAVSQLAFVELSSISSGYYDSTPDHQGIVSGSGVEGLWMAAGLSGHGFMMAPAVAETIVNLMDGSPSPWPTEPLSLWRFGEGSRLAPERNIV